MDPVFKFKFPFDNDLLFKEFESVRHTLTEYADPRNLMPSSNWLVSRELEKENVPYVNNITKALVIKYGITGYVSPRFYMLTKNTILRDHIDLNTKCSINHVILGEESPVTYTGYGAFFYETALLDTTLTHGVMNKGDDRILFKLSIFDETFDQVKSKLL